MRRGRHGCERALQQLGETETRKGRLEPTPADEVRYLAPNLGARFGSDLIRQFGARPAKDEAGDRLRPDFAAAPAQLGVGIGENVDIGDFQPQVGKRLQALPRMDSLREEYRIDAARTGPAHDVGHDAQPQGVLVLDRGEEFGVDPVHSAARRYAGMVVAAGAGEVPQLPRDAVHIDRQADPAVADECDPQFLLPHRHPCAHHRMDWQLRSSNVPASSCGWLNPRNAMSVRPVAVFRTAGRASAPIARNGTHWSKMRPRRCSR